MRSRVDILRDLITLNGDLRILESELSKYPWDIDEPLLTLEIETICQVLNRAYQKKISFEELENWANLIELREDILLPSIVEEIIFDIANPILSGRITKNKIQNIIKKICV